jgi:hypothetical protein
MLNLVVVTLGENERGRKRERERGREGGREGGRERDWLTLEKSERDPFSDHLMD